MAARRKQRNARRGASGGRPVGRPRAEARSGGERRDGADGRESDGRDRAGREGERREGGRDRAGREGERREGDGRERGRAPAQWPERLCFRAPASAPGTSAGALLARALAEWTPAARAARLAAGGAARLEGGVERVLRASDELVPPGAEVRVALARGERDALASGERDEIAFASGGSPRAAERAALLALVATPPWPRGSLAVPARAPRAAGRGRERDGAPGASRRIAFAVEREGGGLAWLRIEPEERAAPDRAAAPGARADALPISVRDVLDALAALGMPVVGDRLAGGVLVDDDAPGSPGGAALARGGAHRAQWRRAAIGADGSVARVPAIAPALARAAAGLGAPASERGAPPVPLRISHAAARALARGHPWVLRDPGCDDALAHRPGALVELRDRERGDRAIALALADGDGTCVARCLPRGAAGASIEQRVDAAIARRGALAFPPVRGDRGRAGGSRDADEPGDARAPGGGRDATDAVRLVHGEADALPGLAIDRLGPALRALVVGRAGLGIARVALARAAERLEAELGRACVAIEVVHVRAPAAARGAALVQASVVRGDAAWLARDGEGRFEVRERGLAFGVEPGLADPTRAMPGVGLFLDQRDNRERLARFARATGGGRWLNLFAHTGAFSVALLAAGAAEVTSVDLSARYLRWLDDNLARNRAHGVDARRHVAARRDGRRFLEVLGARERFRGIVLDPPTAAAAGRKHWSIRKDLQPLVEKALEHLEPGGRLLVCRNDRARRGPSLEDACEAAARAAGVRLARLDAAPPGPDFPSLPGFPEGDPFRGVLLERAP